MSATENETTPENPDNSSISEGDLRRLIGEELDQRFKDHKPAEINLDEFKSNLMGEIGTLLERERSSRKDFDSDGFARKIESMIDGKLSSIGIAPQKGGPLSRWLGLS